MQIPGVPGVMPQWFAPSPRLSILESCPEQYDPLSTLCCAPGTHSFASYDDADCLALPRLRLPATACHRETSALFPVCGEKTFFNVSPIHVKRFTHCTQFFQLVERRLRPTAPVKQGVNVLHDFTQLAQMRQTSGQVQEPLAFTRFQMTLDKQEAIVEQVTDFLLDILTFAGSAAGFFIFGRRSTALQLRLGLGQALTLFGHRLQHPFGQVFDHMEGTKLMRNIAKDDADRFRIQG